MPKLPLGGLLIRLRQRPAVPVCAGTLPLCCAIWAQTPAAVPPSAPSLLRQQTAADTRLTGEVLSDDGAMVAGATVRLTSPLSHTEAQVSSDQNGGFVFSGVVAGPYRLTVTLPGFTPSEREVQLDPGETLALEPTVLFLASVNITVEAVTQEQLALEELHAEEHQRLVGVLPNFFVSYNWSAPPLTAGQKFRLATRNATDPGNLALVGTVAGVQQAANAFPGYGQGAAGYGRRYGADLGNLVAGTYLGGAILPSLFRQDPRYFYKGTGTLRSRVLYSLSRSVITRGDNGHEQPNFSGILGDLSASALSNLYYPASDRQGATLFLENGILAIAGDAMNDIVQEFVLPHFTSRGKTQSSGTKP